MYAKIVFYHIIHSIFVCAHTHTHTQERFSQTLCKLGGSLTAQFIRRMSKSSENLEKVAKIPGEAISVKSCHISGCHVFVLDVSILQLCLNRIQKAATVPTPHLQPSRDSDPLT